MAGSAQRKSHRCLPHGRFHALGKRPGRNLPAVMGHEGGAIVLEVGKGVAGVKRGDHVIPLYIPECGQCKFCRSGRTNLCGAIRTTQSGRDAGWHVAFSTKGKPFTTIWAPRHFPNTRLCTSMAIKNKSGRSFGKSLSARVWYHDRNWRRPKHRES